MSVKPHPAARARSVVLVTASAAAVGLAGYFAIATPATQATPAGAATTEQPATTGTIPSRPSHRRSSPSTPAPVVPRQTQPHTRSSGS